MVDATIVLQHVEQRKTCGEILSNHLGAVDLKRRSRLSEHEETSGMVDLTVDEDDCLDPGIPNAVSRMRFRKVFELCSYIR